MHAKRASPIQLAAKHSRTVNLLVCRIIVPTRNHPESRRLRGPLGEPWGAQSEPATRVKVGVPLSAALRMEAHPLLRAPVERHRRMALEELARLLVVGQQPAALLLPAAAPQPAARERRVVAPQPVARELRAAAPQQVAPLLPAVAQRRVARELRAALPRKVALPRKAALPRQVVAPRPAALRVR